jgi:hypothetical protein
MHGTVLVIFSLMASLLAVIFSLDCGKSLALIYPKLALKKQVFGNTINPLWRINNLLFIVTTLLMGVVISHSYIHYDNSIFTYIVIGLLAFIVKTFLILVMSKQKKSVNNNIVKSVYLISSYAVVLIFSALGVYLITDKQFWVTLVGWVSIITALLGATIIGLSFINRSREITKNSSLKQIQSAIFAIWVVMLGYVFPVSLAHYNLSLIGVSMSILEIVIIASVIGYAIAVIKDKKPQQLYHFTFFIGIATPFLLVWNNRPYLVSNNIELAKATRIASYGGGYEWVIYLLLAISLVFVVTSLLYIYNLILSKYSLN